MAVRPIGGEIELTLPAVVRPRAGVWTTLRRFVRKKPLGAAGGVLMAAMVVTAIFANVLQTHDPIATDAAHTLAAPSAEHWLGSDHLGRDIYSRIVHGARVSLIVGLASTLLGSVLGGIIGLLSGYVGGKTDLITQRFLDILQGLPLLVLALVMSAALGPSVQNVIIAISIPIIPRAARVIRSSVLSIREMQYVEAARALGVSHLRIAFRHILPNTMGPFIVLGTAQLGGAILVEATLSFLGLGVPEPYPSWGHALGVGGGVRAEGAAPGDVPGPGDQPRRLRLQPARRRVARHPRSPAPRQLIETRPEGADDDEVRLVLPAARLRADAGRLSGRRDCTGLRTLTAVSRRPTLAPCTSQICSRRSQSSVSSSPPH